MNRLQSKGIKRNGVAGHASVPSATGGRAMEQCKMDVAGEQVRCEGYYESDDDYDEN
ncbi:MAG: hypothetical protein KJ556_20625 [Gammaproteobacteria bacterium]|nr:hypothetical protein [Gammaproteobacteria bacterium]